MNITEGKQYSVLKMPHNELIDATPATCYQTIPIDFLLFLSFSTKSSIAAKVHTACSHCWEPMEFTECGESWHSMASTAISVICDF